MTQEDRSVVVAYAVPPKPPRSEGELTRLMAGINEELSRVTRHGAKHIAELIKADPSGSAAEHWLGEHTGLMWDFVSCLRTLYWEREAARAKASRPAFTLAEVAEAVAEMMNDSVACAQNDAWWDIKGDSRRYDFDNNSDEIAADILARLQARFGKDSQQ